MAPPQNAVKCRWCQSRIIMKTEKHWCKLVNRLNKCWRQKVWLKWTHISIWNFPTHWFKLIIYKPNSKIIIILILGSMSEIYQFIKLAESQKGRACAALINQVIQACILNTIIFDYSLLCQVLSHKRIFTFGELLAIPSIASVISIFSVTC